MNAYYPGMSEDEDREERIARSIHDEELQVMRERAYAKSEAERAEQTFKSED